MTSTIQDRPATAAVPVLFVSHHPDLRAAARRALGRAGYDVIAVPHSGHAILACIERPDLALVIIENQLPEGRGGAIAATLRRYCPDLQIIRMCDAGAAGGGVGREVRRPFTADALLEALADASLTSAS